MTVECFLDTNILLYSASRNPQHHIKKMMANELIKNAKFAISTQVLQEFYVNVVRKSAFAMQPELALEWIGYLEQFPCQSMSVEVVKTGIAFSNLYRISYWDGAILAAATALEAAILYTEDLNHGQKYGPVTAINPFLDAQKTSMFLA